MHVRRTMEAIVGGTRVRGRGRSGRRGVSLVEVLMALVLLFFGLGGLLDLYTNQVRHLAETRHEAQALFLAESLLVELRAAGYSALSARVGALAEPRGSGEAVLESDLPSIPVGDLNYTWRADLRQDDADGLPRIAITVSVEWASALGADETRAREVTGYVLSR